MNAIHPFVALVLGSVAWVLLAYVCHKAFSKMFPRFAAHHSPETGLVFAAFLAAIAFAVFSA